MACENRSVNVDSLWRVERIYRNRLAHEPTDMVARAGLAWCLFLQALHRAGEESTLQAMLNASGKVSLTEPKGRDSETLLQDSMLNAATVLQLSPHGQERIDVERLQTLVELSGGFAVVAEAQESAQEILEQIAREMHSESDLRPGRQRRPAKGVRRQPPSSQNPEAE